MLKIANGKCKVQCDGPEVRRIEGVTYKGHPVYICREAVIIGRYMAAYIVPDGEAVRFGEIKLTTGHILHNNFNGNYVLCEY